MGLLIVIGRPERAQFKTGWGAKNKRKYLKRSVIHKNVNYQFHCEMIDTARCGRS